VGAPWKNCRSGLDPAQDEQARHGPCQRISMHGAAVPCPTSKQREPVGGRHNKQQGRYIRLNTVHSGSEQDKTKQAKGREWSWSKRRDKPEAKSLNHFPFPTSRGHSRVGFLACEAQGARC